MRVMIAGTGRYALDVYEGLGDMWGIEMVGAALSREQGDPLAQRLRVWPSLPGDLPWVDIEDLSRPEMSEKLRDWQVDLLVLTPPALELHPNVHAAPALGCLVIAYLQTQRVKIYRLVSPTTGTTVWETACPMPADPNDIVQEWYYDPAVEAMLHAVATVRDELVVTPAAPPITLRPAS